MACHCKPNMPAFFVPVKLHHPTERGFTTAGVDACIASLVQALNDGGFQTVASCCGHNQRPGMISLEDGRELIVMPDWECARRIDHLWPDTLGNPHPSALPGQCYPPLRRAAQTKEAIEAARFVLMQLMDLAKSDGPPLIQDWSRVDRLGKALKAYDGFNDG